MRGARFIAACAALLLLPSIAFSAESIGSYTTGCIKGTESIEDGEGYQLMRPSRDRHYGHPVLIHFIQSFAKKLKAKSGGVLLVGDIGQKKGGPMLSGHSSHQVGLDVDMWFTYPPEAAAHSLSSEQREELSAVSLIDEIGAIRPSVWSPRIPLMLKLAASYPEVERIFVNPAIKYKLCQHYKGEAWLHKVRPWWGHNEHFHVRLSCQKGSPDCKAQEPLPPGDGCDKSLAWWFGKEAQLPQSKPDPERYAKRLAALPDACKAYMGIKK